MTAIRSGIYGVLLALFIVGAVVDQPGRMERVPPRTQVIRPATPAEQKAAELIRELEQRRAEQPDAEVISR